MKNISYQFYGNGGKLIFIEKLLKRAPFTINGDLVRQIVEDSYKFAVVNDSGFVDPEDVFDYNEYIIELIKEETEGIFLIALKDI